MAAIESPIPPYSTPNGVAHVNGNGNGNGILHDGLSDGPASTFDPAVLRTYMLALLPAMIGASPVELESLFDDEFDERVHRFAGEGGGVIYVVKKKDEAEEDAPPTYTYKLTLQMTYDSTHVMTIAIIKRGPILDATASLSTQLHVLNLFGGEDTPYESLHSVVSYAVKPWFEAFVGARHGGKDGGDSKMGIPMTKKKFAELELSLLHLQQNVEIPETHLVIHPIIQRTVEQARADGRRPSISDIPSKLLNDSTFLNTLHSHVNQWIKSIQTVTKLSRDVSSGTASQEINFWLSLERALEGIENQLRSEEVNIVMECLRNAKRFHATVSFMTDTGLKTQRTPDFPLNELLSATDLDKINEALIMIFGHINRKLKLLTSHRLLYMPYETFERLLSQTMEIFRTWDDNIKEFTNVAREVTRKRMERFIPIKVVPAHAKLQDRCRYLRDWRKQHEQLAVMTGPTKGLGGVGMEIGGVDMEAEVKEAYEVMKRIDVLDVSVGSEIWVAAENAYNERTARNANEMFRVFSKFNALFVRPKIRGAIQEYQTQLIDSYAPTYTHIVSQKLHMSQMRDLPPISGALSGPPIDRQLQTLGQGLGASESAAFRKKLDTRPVYDAWMHDINRRDMGVNGRLFEIVRLLNFDPQIITLFKEVRNLLWQNFQVPHAIQTWPRMRTRTVRTYGQTLDLWLVAEYRNEAQRMVTRGMNIRWDHFVNQYDTARYVRVGRSDNRHIQFVREFASVVSSCSPQDKTNNVIDLYKDITRAVEELSTALHDRSFTAIDRLNLEGYANLEHWVAELDQRIEGILLQRLVQTIQLWCSEFDRNEEADGRREPLVLRDITNKRRGDKRVKEEKPVEGILTLKPIVHEIRIQNQLIFLDPPIEHARQNWTRQLHDWLGVVCRLRRIQSSRYEIGLQMQGHTTTEATYTSLLTHFTDATLERPFLLIEQKVQQLREYVAKWLQFQSLWDLEAEYVFSRLGDSLANWQQLLTEIKKARSTFDTSETQKSFGVCVIDYEQVQARVNAKYDAWQRDILSRFGVKLGNAMKDMHATILKARNDLEHQSIEGLVGAPRRF
ncbi:cytoplasmic dynein heavy chain 1 [Fomitopsis serialis]|uniref:cytoplasmic dynein heavy chain 1 n=1 Tax=Fomitopsis serialis TaxID=139415 RepID=UPI0020074C47|nr:cytoplasmic dynein heavy chain 1 [Neoantrodia serialis]KAH9920337.1 cytoplasmic dynein heavy chain 1 [Neoantrodia serialis]